jgi:hypothetical protein
MVNLGSSGAGAAGDTETSVATEVPAAAEVSLSTEVSMYTEVSVSTEVSLSTEVPEFWYIMYTPTDALELRHAHQTSTNIIFTDKEESPIYTTLVKKEPPRMPRAPC